MSWSCRNVPDVLQDSFQKHAIGLQVWTSIVATGDKGPCRKGIRRVAVRGRGILGHILEALQLCLGCHGGRGGTGACCCVSARVHSAKLVRKGPTLTAPHVANLQ